MAVWLFLISPPPPLVAGQPVPLERQSNRIHIFIWDVFTDSENAPLMLINLTQTPLPPTLCWGKQRTLSSKRALFPSFRQRQKSQHISASPGDKGQCVTHPGRSLNSLTFAATAACFSSFYFRRVDQYQRCFAITETHRP